ncbi:MAG: hypothetical protein LBO78_02690 [Rickettsiales bacterium]|jgi:hypothetical protein|nr:hypothetical protein [Rickettsiales bacterium]
MQKIEEEPQHFPQKIFFHYFIDKVNLICIIKLISFIRKKKFAETTPHFGKSGESQYRSRKSFPPYFLSPRLAGNLIGGDFETLQFFRCFLLNSAMRFARNEEHWKSIRESILFCS